MVFGKVAEGIPNYFVFGRVIKESGWSPNSINLGMDVVMAIEASKTNNADKPIQTIVIAECGILDESNKNKNAGDF